MLRAGVVSSQQRGEGSFGRAAKAIYENFEQADRAAKSQRIE